MKRKREETLAVPMSSMIDVVFLLLIYFIVTQKEEITEAHLAVNLPSPGSSKTTETKPQLLEIEVYDGRIALRGKVMPDDATFASLMNNFRDPELTVMIKVSVGARAKDLVKVLDYCQGAGLTKLNVVTLR